MNSQLPMTGRAGRLASRTPCLYARSAMRRQTIATGLAQLGVKDLTTVLALAQAPSAGAFPADRACFYSSTPKKLEALLEERLVI